MTRNDAAIICQCLCKLSQTSDKIQRSSTRINNPSGRGLSGTDQPDQHAMHRTSQFHVAACITLRWSPGPVVCGLPLRLCAVVLRPSPAGFGRRRPLAGSQRVL